MLFKLSGFFFFALALVDKAQRLRAHMIEVSVCYKVSIYLYIMKLVDISRCMECV